MKYITQPHQTTPRIGEGLNPPVHLHAGPEVGAWLPSVSTTYYCSPLILRISVASLSYFQYPHRPWEERAVVDCSLAWFACLLATSVWVNAASRPTDALPAHLCPNRRRHQVESGTGSAISNCRILSTAGVWVDYCVTTLKRLPLQGTATNKASRGNVLFHTSRRWLAAVVFEEPCREAGEI